MRQRTQAVVEAGIVPKVDGLGLCRQCIHLAEPDEYREYEIPIGHDKYFVAMCGKTEQLCFMQRISLVACKHYQDSNPPKNFFQKLWEAFNTNFWEPFKETK